MQDFCIAHLREIRWSALTFSHMLLPYLNSPLKSLQHKLHLLKLYIYGKKVGKKIQKSDSRTKIVFSLVLFRRKYDGVPPKSRTLLLVHLKRIGLCCNGFLERWCIRFIWSIHHNKFGQRKSRKFKISVLLI